MLIRGARVALEGAEEATAADVLVRGGRVAEIAPRLQEEPGEQVVDACGLLMVPGAVDPHVHFNDPGYTDREDFLSGTSAAASGGVTTVIDMPCTSVPAVTSLAALREKEEAIRGKAVVDYGLFGGVSAQSYAGGHAEAMADLAPEVLGYKVYSLSGMEEFGSLGHYELEVVLAEARALDLPVLLHAEDAAYVRSATVDWRSRGDRPSDYYHSRPETAELLAAEAAVTLAASVAGNLHIVHVGTPAVAELVGRTRAAAPPGLTLTAETAPHYLAFDLTDFEKQGSILKINPPLKAQGSREALWRLLAGGAIDFVASDHAPCPASGKGSGSIWSDYAGIPGCPTLLLYLYSEGHVAGRLSLGRLVQVVSTAAARRYGIAGRKGSIAPGRDADLVLIDPASETVVRGADSPSRGKLTPFEGVRLRGRIVRTYVRGRMVWEDGRGVTAEPGWGERLVRGQRRRGT